jgi:serine O-acetyltransferase
MICSIKGKDLASYVQKQVSLFFPDNDIIEASQIEKYLDEVMGRLEFCFSHIDNKYYFHNGRVLFNHLNGDHYASFLYFLSNTIWLKSKDARVPSKIFLLNKALHGIDLFYEVSMPDIFILVHPVGAVLGRATYGNYLRIYQGCTVGSIHGKGYPIIGENLTMYSNSSLLGSCKIGDNVILGAGARVFNSIIDSEKTLVGQHPFLRELKNRSNTSPFFR